MEAESAPSDDRHIQREPLALVQDREAIIDAIYELFCSGRPISELLEDARRLRTTPLNADGARAILVTVPPVEGGSQTQLTAASDHNADREASHSLAQPELWTQIAVDRSRRNWLATGSFLFALTTAICVSPGGTSGISVEPSRIEPAGAGTAAPKTEQDGLPGSSAETAAVREDVPSSAAAAKPALTVASLAPTEVTSLFEEFRRQYLLGQDLNQPGRIEPAATPPSSPALRAGSSDAHEQQAAIVLRGRRARKSSASAGEPAVPHARLPMASAHAQPSPGTASRTYAPAGPAYGPPFAVPPLGPVWGYDRLIGRYVPLAGGDIPPFQP